MIKIRLYGHLGKQFGKLHHYAIRTPIEAMRALEANCPGFKLSILKKDVLGYKIIVDGQDRSTKEALAYPADIEIKFIPIVAGKGSGWTNIIIGVVLIVVGFFTYGSTWNAVPFYFAGAMQIYTGVTLLLYKPPNAQLQEAVLAEKNPNRYFNGPSGIGTQGHPIPVAYGKVLAGYTVVHGLISTVER